MPDDLEKDLQHLYEDLDLTLTSVSPTSDKQEDVVEAFQEALLDAETFRDELFSIKEDLTDERQAVKEHVDAGITALEDRVEETMTIDEEDDVADLKYAISELRNGLEEAHGRLEQALTELQEEG